MLHRGQVKGLVKAAVPDFATHYFIIFCFLCLVCVSDQWCRAMAVLESP